MAVNYGLEPNIVDMDGLTQHVGFHEASDDHHLHLGRGRDARQRRRHVERHQCKRAGPWPLFTFSVCAIGDSSYDEFCKAGHDWNGKLASLGGTEAYPIKECDVDFEPPWLQFGSTKPSRSLRVLIRLRNSSGRTS